MEKFELLLKLGHVIKYARSKKNWSQDDLADAVDISKTTIATVECGKVNVTFSTLYKICKALDIDMGVFNNFQL